MCAKEDSNDEEKTYVYLFRYSTLVDEIRIITQDERFVQSRFGNNYRWCKDQLCMLRKNLTNRYNELYESDSSSMDKQEQSNVKDQQLEVVAAEDPGKLFASGKY